MTCPMNFSVKKQKRKSGIGSAGNSAKGNNRWLSGHGIAVLKLSMR
jgi:hypothetical protein